MSGADKRRTCCRDYDCMYCNSGCCYSGRSRAAASWDFSAALEAWYVACGNQEFYEALLPYASGSASGWVFELSGTSPAWVPEKGQSETEYIGLVRYCSDTPGVSVWVLNFGRSVSGQNGAATLAWLSDDACCGTGEAVEADTDITFYPSGGGHCSDYSTGSMSITISRNRCAHAPQGDLVVTGTLDPDVTGNYNLAGTHNGGDYYEREDSAYFIYLYADIFGDVWVIGDELGTADVAWALGYGGPDPTGEYTPVNESSGAAIVAAGLETTCAKTVTDQC